MKVKPVAAGLSLAALLLLAVPSMPAQAETLRSQGSQAASPISASADLDWAARRLSLTLDLDMAAAGLKLPSGRAEAEALVARDLPGILRGLALGLRVDSRRLVDDCVRDGSVDPGSLLALADAARPVSAAFSKDLRRWRAVYSLDLDEVGAILVRHTHPRADLPPLEYRPSRAFTGIVIFARGELPVHGERVTSRLEPCLFPRIWDEGMRLIMDRDSVAPEALAERGMVGYAASFDVQAEARVGDDPLLIDARAFFGTAVTDILIPREAADRILALPENRALIAAGRVLVIVDKVAAPYPASGP